METLNSAQEWVQASSAWMVEMKVVLRDMREAAVWRRREARWAGVRVGRWREAVWAAVRAEEVWAGVEVEMLERWVPVGEWWGKVEGVGVVVEEMRRGMVEMVGRGGDVMVVGREVPDYGGGFRLVV